MKKYGEVYRHGGQKSMNIPRALMVRKAKSQRKELLIHSLIIRIFGNIALIEEPVHAGCHVVLAIRSYHRHPPSKNMMQNFNDRPKKSSGEGSRSIAIATAAVITSSRAALTILVLHVPPQPPRQAPCGRHVYSTPASTAGACGEGVGAEWLM